LWSVAGCLQGSVTGWLSLAGARGLMGLTEAAAIPAGMKTVAEWFPDKEKSIAVGFFNVGTSFGALLAPPLVAAVTLTLGWRAAFVVTGAIGLFWAALWYAFYRPATQPENIAEPLAEGLQNRSVIRPSFPEVAPPGASRRRKSRCLQSVWPR
jgi:MFS transporter, ACS family, hexuronate transporter